MKSKLFRVWTIGLILALAVLSNGLYAESLSTYTNRNYGFSIQYPSSWEMREKFMNTEVIFLSDAENANDKFQENVNIAVMRVPANTKFEAAKDDTIQQLGRMITNFHLEAERPVTLAGREAYALVYTGTMGQFQFKWQQIFMVANGCAYAITYTAEEKSYNKFFGYFNKMASSFSLK
jgi:hypothetical protein